MIRASLIALGVLAVAAPAFADDVVTFVSCPIFRDTDAGPKSSCWLADDHASGVRYDITRSLTKPDYMHEVLVEGKADPNAKDTCGGVILSPLRDSILPGHCTPHIIPAEGEPGHPYVSPKTNLAPLSTPRPAPPGPYVTRDFTLLYDVDSSFMIYQYDDYWFDQAVTWAKYAKPAQIIVTGYAATDPVTISGHVIQEDPGVAQERAEGAADALVRMGIPKSLIVTRWKTGADAQPDLANGLPEASKRRVTITMQMGPLTASR